MDSAISSRVIREKEFHERRFHGFDHRDSQKKYYWAIWDGAQAYMDAVENLSAENDVLEYGCGDADNWIRIAPVARSLTGIDISSSAISRLQSCCGTSNASYHVMDAHQLAFEDRSFDLVFGSGIIHHLDTQRAANEIARVLRPGGKAIFWEPLGLNPLINAYRSATPSARTPDEHPMLPADYRILEAAIGPVELKFFGLTTLASVPLPDGPVRLAAFNALRAVDKAITAFPGMRYLSWYCLSALTRSK